MMGLEQKYLCCAVAQNLISALWTGKFQIMLQSSAYCCACG